MKPFRKSNSETRRRKFRNAAALLAASGLLIVFAVCSGMIFGKGVSKYLNPANADEYVSARSSHCCATTGAEVFGVSRTDITPPAAAELKIERRGSGEAVYSDVENKFTFVAVVDFTSAYASNLDFKWFYKQHGADDFIQSPAEDAGNVFLFGMHADSGSYDIKAELTATYYADGEAHTMAPVTDVAENACKVVKSSVNTDNLPSQSITYGQTFDDIKIFDVLSRGDWSFDKSVVKRADDGGSDWVSVESMFDGNGVLYAGKYLIKASCTPFDSNNYEPLNNVSLPLSVNPRPVKVYIEDEETVEGKPLVSNGDFVSYLVHNGEIVDDSYVLVGEDTYESLGITLAKESGDSPGKYKIYGESGNGNYDITFVGSANPDGFFSIGGTYTIRPNSLSVLINGMVRVTVTDKENGFPFGATLSYAEETGGLPESASGKAFLGRYEFTVNFDEGVVSLNGGVSVSADNFVLAANYVLFAPASDNAAWTQKTVENGKAVFTVSSRVNGFSMCFASVSVPPEQDLLWLDFTLGVFDSLLLLFLYILFLQLYAKRRDELK